MVGTLARIALVAAVCALVLVPRLGLACGGCFTPPPDAKIDATVKQDAERVLFVQDQKTKASTVWVEVRYTGLAKDFGWVLPLPKVPKVGVGTVFVFDALDQRMGARVGWTYGPAENCRNPSDGCDHFEYPMYDAVAELLAMDASAGAGDAGGSAPQVEILAAGQTGPYDYVVVKGSDAAVLYKWLNDNGYATPPKAKPILQSHIDKGDVFVAIKLQNGQGINAIRPIALTMQDAEPCVPLRLTSIAAVDDMAVIVTVAGPGRAVVKNGLDVVVNPLRLTLSSGKNWPCVPPSSGKSLWGCLLPGNYNQVVAAAIDEAGGHAFVTEYAQAGTSTGQLSPMQGFSHQSMATAKTLWDLGKVLAGGTLPVTVEVAATLAPHLQVTGKFKELPTVQVLSVVRACVQFWGQQMSTAFCQVSGLTLQVEDLVDAPVDGVALADAVTSEIVGPINEIATALGQAPTVTRLHLRISPEEMDRDPVFAFNAGLPPVEALQVYARNTVCMSGWYYQGNEATRMTIGGLGTWVVKEGAGIDPRFVKTPLAWKLRLQDELGAAVDIDPGQAGVIDMAVAGAKPGKPSLPSGLVVNPVKPWTVPPSDPLVTFVGPWWQPPYCVPKPGWEHGQPPPVSVPPKTGAELADVTSGPVPGVDAAGGWNETAPGVEVPEPPDAPPAPVQTAKSKIETDDGCTAARLPGSAWVVALWLAALAVVIRRRTA